jgi:hypothetical protein
VFVRDLREENRVQVVVEVEVTASDASVSNNTAHVLEYELSFVSAESGKTIVQRGIVEAQFTSDPNVAANS